MENCASDFAEIGLALASLQSVEICCDNDKDKIIFPSGKVLLTSYTSTATMPKSLEKTRKKISKKKGNIDALHENSRGTTIPISLAIVELRYLEQTVRDFDGRG
jgi:hypothetical protein